MILNLEFQYLKTNNIKLNVVQTGPKDGLFVVLLHGFPEFWYGWRNQIPYLAKSGFHLWVPDQRGYNLSDKPKGIEAYNFDNLVEDVIGLIDASGREKVSLVGHDWGAGVAWGVAEKYPQRLDKLVIINVPHFSVMLDNLKQNPTQLLRSWYVFFFQIPWLPEAIAHFGNWQILVNVLKKTSRAETFTDSDIELYRQAWSQPEAYTSMLNWYRALLQKRPMLAPSHRIIVPTLLIWGAKDMFLGREMAQPSIDLCDEGCLVFFEEATHWVQHEKSDQVNELIEGFLKC